MRISDWSSDVCSSDLRPRAPQLVERHAAVEDVAADQPETGFEIIGRQREMADHRLPEAGCCRFDGIENRRDGGVAMRLPRPAERRVGKAEGSSFRSWWSPYYYKTKNNSKNRQ